MNNHQILELIKAYPMAAMGNMAFIEECNRGENDISINELLYARSFTPSHRARRSYLYLQMLVAVEFSARHFTSRSDMSSYLLTQTFSGSGQLIYDGKMYDIAAGDCFMIDCRKQHDYRATSPLGWGYRIIHFDGQAMADYYDLFSQRGSVKFTAANNSRIYELIDRLFMVNGVPHAFDDVRNACILTEIITETITPSAEQQIEQVPHLIDTVLQYISESYHQPLSLDQVAEKFFVSKYHLCHEFKKHTGTTLNECLIRARLNAAKDLLRLTRLSIAEISSRVGIPSPNHFLYLFRNRAGITPSAYRNQWQHTS